jgi:hypothetical protein
MSEAFSESKKIDMGFNPVFNNKKVRIYKKSTNKVCTKLNCTLNGIDIILNLLQSVVFFN